MRQTERQTNKYSQTDRHGQEGEEKKPKKPNPKRKRKKYTRIIRTKISAEARGNKTCEEERPRVLRCTMLAHGKTVISPSKTACGCRCHPSLIPAIHRQLYCLQRQVEAEADRETYQLEISRIQIARHRGSFILLFFPRGRGRGGAGRRVVGEVSVKHQQKGKFR